MSCRRSTGSATGRADVRARDLRQMRMKLEKEQGAAHPLKAGRGGYYDIDFMLMYLRLKSAGVYYKVLNTPERIEVLENMGHLDRAGREFLNQAATFYRALDHAIRVLTGHAEAKLPIGNAGGGARRAARPLDPPSAQRPGRYSLANPRYVRAIVRVKSASGTQTTRLLLFPRGA